MRRSNQQIWQVEVECPQCGAPLVLEEADRILPCAYCRTRLYLSAKDFFRYYLSPTVTPKEEIFFVPYSRVKGIIFCFRDMEVRRKILDTNCLALEDRTLPPTLGLRPQILRLRFPGPETAGRFMRPSFASPDRGWNLSDSGMEIPDQRSRRKLPGYYESFLGETRSIIYSPVFVRGGRCYDAILQRPVATVSETFDSLSNSARQHSRWLEFIPTLCPRCGWDLEGEKETLVLLCKNCQTAWEAHGTGFRPVEFTVMGGDESTSLHLPFWRVSARIFGETLGTYGDLAEFANLPRRLPGDERVRDLHFWIPAFKVNPILYLRLAKTITIFQPRGEVNSILPKTALYPVTLPVGEASEGVKLATATLAVPKAQFLSRLAEIRVDIVQHLLTYIPFTARGSELIQTTMLISVQRKALALGRLF